MNGLRDPVRKPNDMQLGKVLGHGYKCTLLYTSLSPGAYVGYGPVGEMHKIYDFILLFGPSALTFICNLYSRCIKLTSTLV